MMYARLDSFSASRRNRAHHLRSDDVGPRRAGRKEGLRRGPVSGWEGGGIRESSRQRGSGDAHAAGYTHRFKDFPVWDHSPVEGSRGRDLSAPQAEGGSGGVIQRKIIDPKTREPFESEEDLKGSQWFKGFNKERRQLLLKYHRHGLSMTQEKAEKMLARREERARSVLAEERSDVKKRITGKPTIIKKEPTYNRNDDEDSSDSREERISWKKKAVKQSEEKKVNIKRKRSDSSSEDNPSFSVEEVPDPRGTRNNAPKDKKVLRKEISRSDTSSSDESQEVMKKKVENSTKARKQPKKQKRTNKGKRKAIEKKSAKNEPIPSDERVKRRIYDKTRARGDRENIQEQFRQFKAIKEKALMPLKQVENPKAKNPDSISVSQVMMQIGTSQGNLRNVPIASGGNILSFINKKKALGLNKKRVDEIKKLGTIPRGVIDSVGTEDEFTSKLGLNGMIKDTNAHGEVSFGEHMLHHQEDIRSSIDDMMDDGEEPTNVNLRMVMDKPPCTGCHRKMVKMRRSLSENWGKLPIKLSYLYPRTKSNTKIRAKYQVSRKGNVEVPDTHSGDDSFEEASLTEED